MPGVDLREVGAHPVQVDGPGVAGRRHVHGARLENDEPVALVDRVAGADFDRAHDARDRRRDDVLHLHRFHDDELAAGGHLVARGDVDGDDRALHRRPHDDRVVGNDGRRRDPRAGGLAVDEDGERIPRVDPRAGAAGRGDIGVPVGVRDVRGELGDVLVDEPRRHAVRDDGRMAEKIPQDRDVRRDPVDPELAERAVRFRDDAGEVGASRDHLREQRVEAR